MRGENLPTYVVWSHPAHMQRQPQVDELPAPIYSLMMEIFHPPVYHFWVQQILLEELHKRSNRFKEYQGSLLPVDIGISQSGYEDVKLYYHVQDDSVLRDLGRWLTEQIAAAMLHGFPGGGNGFDICVRCIYVGPEPQTDWANPCNRGIQQWTHTFLRKIPGVTLWDLPPFLLCFPRAMPKKTTRIRFHNLVGASQPSYDQFDIDLKPGKCKYILPEKPLPSLYPLTDAEHAKITAVVFPSDSAVLLYIQHSGKHETWVYGGPGGDTVTTLGGWSMVPRDGWMPLYPGNRIVLGRIVQTADGARIVSGSIVLKVEYPVE